MKKTNSAQAESVLILFESGREMRRRSVGTPLRLTEALRSTSSSASRFGCLFGLSLFRFRFYYRS